MSYHSQLSAEASSVRHEGPSFLDDVAHRIAELCVLRSRDFGDALASEQRALTAIYERAMKTISAMYDHGATSPAHLLAILRETAGAEILKDDPDHGKLYEFRELAKIVAAHQADAQ